MLLNDLVCIGNREKCGMAGSCKQFHVKHHRMGGINSSHCLRWMGAGHSPGK